MTFVWSVQMTAAIGYSSNRRDDTSAPPCVSATSWYAGSKSDSSKVNDFVCPGDTVPRNVRVPDLENTRTVTRVRGVRLLRTVIAMTFSDSGAAPPEPRPAAHAATSSSATGKGTRSELTARRTPVPYISRDSDRWHCVPAVASHPECWSSSDARRCRKTGGPVPPGPSTL